MGIPGLLNFTLHTHIYIYIYITHRPVVLPVFSFGRCLIGTMEEIFQQLGILPAKMDLLKSCVRDGVIVNATPLVM